MTSPSSFKVGIEKIKYKNIFLLSDLHFGVRANSLEWLQNHLQFFENFYIPYLKENMQDGDILFILGDWFDNRQLLDINVLNRSIDLVIELSEIIPLYFITGNHDIYKKYDTDVNSLRPFKAIPNVIVYEKPLIITNGESKILVLPWVGDEKMEEEYVKKNDHNYVFAHTNIAGFSYDNGRQIHKGAKFTQIGGIKRLFSGHIHKRQEYQQYIYIGSPYSTKRSDIGNKKGLYKFNPSDNTVQFTENTFSPLFQKVPLENMLELTLNESIDIFNNNYSDIIVRDKHIHLFNLTKFVDLLEDCKYKKIETVGERKMLGDDLTEMVEGVDIKDILTLLENSIEDLQHQAEVLIKLKLLNKKYYALASKEDLN